MGTSPLLVEIALHYHCSGTGDYGASEGCGDAPAVVGGIAFLLDLGLLRKSLSGKRAYEPTEGCRVWVDALCSTPFPVQRWVIPERGAA